MAQRQIVVPKIASQFANSPLYEVLRDIVRRVSDRSNELDAIAAGIRTDTNTLLATDSGSSFLTASAASGLGSERVLTAGKDIELTDGGPNATMTVNCTVNNVGNKTLTNGVVTAFATVALADGAATAGEVLYRVVVTDGADRQVLHGHLSYTGARNNATYAKNAAEVGSQHSACTSGALSGAMSVDAASSLLTMSATFTSTLASPTVTLYYRFYTTDTPAVTGL